MPPAACFMLAWAYGLLGGARLAGASRTTQHTTTRKLGDGFLLHVLLSEHHLCLTSDLSWFVDTQRTVEYSNVSNTDVCVFYWWPTYLMYLLWSVRWQCAWEEAVHEIISFLKGSEGMSFYQFSFICLD